MKRNILGEQAMEYISDYPLYVSGTSNITYEQAIAVAKALNKDWRSEMVEMARFEGLTFEQQEKELKRQGII